MKNRNHVENRVQAFERVISVDLDLLASMMPTVMKPAIMSKMDPKQKREEARMIGLHISRRSIT